MGQMAWEGPADCRHSRQQSRGGSEENGRVCWRQGCETRARKDVLATLDRQTRRGKRPEERLTDASSRPKRKARDQILRGCFRQSLTLIVISGLRAA